jgi:hypothetical protein
LEKRYHAIYGHFRCNALFSHCHAVHSMVTKIT